ncbi:MAG: class I SAM-dependent methyltransferase [Clostridia bacterium]|nr:class I SAM-dependent methyltransferase [Clostridia bacterium]
MTMTALDLVHETITKYVKDGDTCIDATAGRGYDTAFLCDLVGKDGKVIAFDIQESAIESTQKLLEEKGHKNAQCRCRKRQRNNVQPWLFARWKSLNFHARTVNNKGN